MSDVPPNPNPPAPPAPPAPPSVPDWAKDLTADQIAGLGQLQQQLNYVASTARAEGANSGAKTIAEKFGMTLDQATAKLAQMTEAEKAQMTEAERKIAEADEREQKAAAREAAANDLVLDMLKVSALTNTGMTQAQAQAAKGMLTLPPGELEGDALLAGITASVDNLRNTFPSLFPTEGDPAPATAGGRTPPPDTHTRGTQSAGTAGTTQTAAERANSRFDQRKGKKAS